MPVELCPDVIAFAESPGAHPDRWVLYNVHARTALGVSPEVFEAMAALADPDAAARFEGRAFRVWSVARFSHIDGLLADPSRFRRDAGAWGEPKSLGFSALVDQLVAQCIAVRDMSAYRARFAPKRSVLDRERFGNYHAQLGQHMLTVERKDPAAWWVAQKFTEDLSGIRQDNLYGAVQDRFLERFLPTRLRSGCRVLDLGCGPGVIANKMARMGASVFGVDPNAQYIELARKHAVGDATFEVRPVGAAGALDDLPAGSFDYVYMSDALLFYFVPYGPDQKADLDVLAADLLRLLKPDGAFLSLEPHGVFYLNPWLGAADRPFTVVSEYATAPRWRVTPTVGELVKSVTTRGFVLSHMEEVRCDAEVLGVDSRATHFAAEFPLWHWMEFQKRRPA